MNLGTVVVLCRTVLFSRKVGWPGNECISALKAREERGRPSSEREVLDKGGGGLFCFSIKQIKKGGKKGRLVPKWG